MCNSDLILFFFLCKLKCIFEIFKITQKSQKLTTKNRISNQSGNDPLSNGQKSKFSKKKNRKKLSFGFFLFFTNMHRKRREFHTRTTSCCFFCQWQWPATTFHFYNIFNNSHFFLTNVKR